MEKDSSPGDIYQDNLVKFSSSKEQVLLILFTDLI